MEKQPSSMGRPNQDSFSLAVPQQEHSLQCRLALAAPGTPGRSVQSMLVDFLLTWLQWHWVLELN